MGAASSEPEPPPGPLKVGHGGGAGWGRVPPRPAVGGLRGSPPHACPRPVPHSCGFCARPQSWLQRGPGAHPSAGSAGWRPRRPGLLGPELEERLGWHRGDGVRAGAQRGREEAPPAAAGPGREAAPAGGEGGDGLASAAVRLALPPGVPHPAPPGTAAAQGAMPSSQPLGGGWGWEQDMARAHWPLVACVVLWGPKPESRSPAVLAHVCQC